MYKKILLASSIMAASGAANSATLFAPQDAVPADDIISHTSQGIVQAAAAVETTNYLVTLGAEYTTGDIITLTYSSPIAGGFTPPATINCDDDVRVTGGASAGVLEFGLLSATSTQLNYRVNTQTAGVNNGITSCVLPKVTLDETAAALITSATMTFDAQTAAGVALDTDPAAVTIVEVVDQFAAGTVGTAFNAVVDVTADRLLFVGGPVTDQLTYTIGQTAGDSGGEWSVPAIGAPSVDTDSAPGDSVMASVVSLTNTVVASTGFAFTDTTDAAGILIDATTVDAQAVTDEALSIDGTTLTYSGTMDVAQTLDLTLGASGGVLPVQSYTIASTIVYDTDETETFTAVSAGEFGLNATSVTVYSVPFSSGVIRMLWASNGSAIDGTAEATINHAGATMGPYDLGTVSAGSNASMGSALTDAVTAAGDTMPTEGRGDITFTITSSDTKVLASYFKNGDRVGLESSDTLNSDQETP